MKKNRVKALLEILEKLGYPIFSKDITKEEILTTPSFFVYEKGRMYKKDRDYLEEVAIIFSTRNNEKIDKLGIIQAAEQIGFTFKDCSEEQLREDGAERQNILLIFNFIHQVGKSIW